MSMESSGERPVRAQEDTELPAFCARFLARVGQLLGLAARDADLHAEILELLHTVFKGASPRGAHVIAFTPHPAELRERRCLEQESKGEEAEEEARAAREHIRLLHWSERKRSPASPREPAAGMRPGSHFPAFSGQIRLLPAEWERAAFPNHIRAQGLVRFRDFLNPARIRALLSLLLEQLAAHAGSAARIREFKELLGRLFPSFAGLVNTLVLDIDLACSGKTLPAPACGPGRAEDFFALELRSRLNLDAIKLIYPHVREFLGQVALLQVRVERAGAAQPQQLLRYRFSDHRLTEFQAVFASDVGPDENEKLSEDSEEEDSVKEESVKGERREAELLWHDPKTGLPLRDPDTGELMRFSLARPDDLRVLLDIDGRILSFRIALPSSRLLLRFDCNQQKEEEPADPQKQPGNREAQRALGGRREEKENPREDSESEEVSGGEESELKSGDEEETSSSSSSSSAKKPKRRATLTVESIVPSLLTRSAGWALGLPDLFDWMQRSFALSLSLNEAPGLEEQEARELFHCAHGFLGDAEMPPEAREVMDPVSGERDARGSFNSNSGPGPLAADAVDEVQLPRPASPGLPEEASESKEQASENQEHAGDIGVMEEEESRTTLRVEYGAVLPRLRLLPRVVHRILRSMKFLQILRLISDVANCVSHDVEQSFCAGALSDSEGELLALNRSLSLENSVEDYFDAGGAAGAPEPGLQGEGVLCGPQDFADEDELP